MASKDANDLIILDSVLGVYEEIYAVKEELTKLKTGVLLMVDGYVLLIVNTDKTGATIDRVPNHLKEAVLVKLNALGLDGYGNPIEQVTEKTQA